MEGLLDCVLRDVLTRIGGVDRCVSEFIRVTNTLLPERAFLRVVPELLNGGRTPAGVPVRPQLLGSDPNCLADNAGRVAGMGCDGVDSGDRESPPNKSRAGIEGNEPDAKFPPPEPQEEQSLAPSRRPRIE